MVLPRLPLIGEVMDRTLKFDLPSLFAMAFADQHRKVR